MASGTAELAKGGYDANGNLLYKTDANANTVSYTYDALNRLTYESGAGIANQYEYDGPAVNDDGTPGNGIGRLEWNTNNGNTDRVYEYDPMGRIKYTRGCSPHNCVWNGGPVSTVYDLAGNPTQITYPDGRTIQQNYDGAGRLYQIIDVTPGGAGTQYLNVSGFWPSGTPHTEVLGNGVTLDQELNTRLQASEIWANDPSLPAIANANGNLYDRTINYGSSGNNGNIYSIVDNIDVSRTQSFSYDSLNRLATGSRSDGAYNHAYNYDSFGNMLRHDNLNGDLNYSIDPSTNRLLLNVSDLQYDAAGELIQDPLHSYQYLPNGRLHYIDNGATANYSYYPDDQRSTKVTQSGWTDYIYSNGQPLAEQDSSGTWTDYVYANGQKIAKIIGTNQPTYFVDDHLGTLNMELASDGSVLWQGDYTPFGQDIISNSTSNSFGFHDNGSPTHYKFTGKERDAESGNDYFDARYYSSSMGRWMTPDPSGLYFADPENPQSLNLYGYVRNNPINSIDTDGLLTIVIPGTWWSPKDWNDQNPLLAEATAYFHETHKTWLDLWDPRGDTDYARTTTANGLRDFINNYDFAPGETLNIVTHSHGGNVALGAAFGLNHRIDTLITLGAPFGFAKKSAGVGDWYNVTGSGDDVQKSASIDCWTVAGCATQQGAHNMTVQAPSHGSLWSNQDVRNLWWEWIQNQQSNDPSGKLPSIVPSGPGVTPIPPAPHP